MNERRHTISRVAHGVALHLRHLQEFRGVAYIPVSESSLPAQARTRDVPTSTTTEEPLTRQVDDGGARPQALRDQARTWSAKTKLEYLRQQNIGDCQRCSLAKGRRNIVFGIGNPEAGLMFVGEGPGADEDRLGEPFVGRAGERLTRWIQALGLGRDDVYIANVIKCRPPGNRDPRPDEVDACFPFLRAQIGAIGPKVLVALGRHAGMSLSGRENLPLKAMRRTQLHYRDPKRELSIPLVVTYHPAYVLRRESAGDDGDELDAMILADLRAAVAMTASG